MSEGGEESPPPRLRRKIRKIVMASSSSASDSDDSGPTISTRRRLRVLSDEVGESSDSSVVPRSRRRRALPGLSDSEEYNTSDYTTDHSDTFRERQPSKSLTPGTTKPSGSCSDSSEGNSDKCSICLMSFTNQQIGTPQYCEHIFCLDCITEWSKNVNTCPVDRMKFNFIIVRSHIRGRIVCSQPVEVMEHESSLEMLLEEDHTSCEVCGSANSEETMLLCDSCDHGYHMECLTPPLTTIPLDQWLCPRCADGLIVPNDVMISRRRSSRAARAGDLPGGHQPSTSTEPGRTTRRRTVHRATRATADRTRRKKYKRKQARTFTVEYEVEANGKFPTTQRIKRRLKKRKTKKRQPRTVARRSLVRQSVRAKLATQRGGRAAADAAAGPLQALAARRARAGIAPLSLFGAAHELDYFTEDEDEGGAGAAVALRTRASAAHAAYRQTRRKMIAIPSPTRAASASDILSNILESQTLLHSKRSVVSVAANGNIHIEPESSKSDLATANGRASGQPTGGPPSAGPSDGSPGAGPSDGPPGAGPSEGPPGVGPLGAEPPGGPLAGVRVGVSQGAEGAARQAPYPGQARGGGGGGWGGGYRYPRDHGGGGGHRGAHDNGYGGGHLPRAQYHGGGGRGDDGDGYNGYGDRRPYRYSHDDPPSDRNRRRPNAGFNSRRSAGPAWRPYAGRPDPAPHHLSFGAPEDPLDMRMDRAPPPATSDPGTPRLDKPASSYGPLPEPPAFQFETAAAEAEEDARSDSSLIIDTEKYDPTEPTIDDDDSGEAPTGAVPPAPLAPPASLAPVETILAGLEPAVGVPADVLDSAVRQVLREHRGLLESPPVPRDDRSDDGSDGDCPNFSIYSATSVHIASDASAGAMSGAAAPSPAAPAPAASDGLEDLVQGDGDASPAETPPAPTPPPALYSPPSDHENPAKRKSDEYNEKVSKRCPITTNTRNPIKIKLNTPVLIRRQVSLYDDEDVDGAPESDAVAEPAEPLAAAPEPPADEKEETPELDLDEETEASEEPELDPSERGGTPSIPTSSPPGAADDEAGKNTTGRSEGVSDSESMHPDADRIEKMTESISETEDERSYTPCLDEHREEPDRGIEGLETEMISEDEGNGLFSEEERRSASPPAPGASPSPPGASSPAPAPAPDEGKKRKRKDSKKEGKERKGKSKRGEVAFKKTGKSGKERNYRTRDSEESDDKRRDSGDSERARRRKEKRKDLERYDVRTLVSEKRRRTKDAFGRDVSPRAEPSPSPSRVDHSPRRGRTSPSPRRGRTSSSPRRGRTSPSPRRIRASPSPRRVRTSPSPRRVRLSSSPRRVRLSTSPRRGRLSPSPRRGRLSPSPRRGRLSPSPRRGRLSPSPRRGRPSPSPTPPAPRRSASPRRRRRRSAPRKRRSGSRARKRRRSASGSPKPKAKKKKRARSERPRSRSRSPRRRSPKRKRVRRRSGSRRSAEPAAAPAWSPRPASPRTPPPQPSPAPAPPDARRLRKRRDRSKHRRTEAAGPSKEVFTSGDNILVSVSFKEQEKSEAQAQARRSRRRERRRRRRAAADEALPKPVAIIDLERSPFRELTPSPKNVIVLSDDELGAAAAPPAAPAAAPAPGAAPEPAGPKTPPEPAAAPAAPPPAPAPAAAPDEPRGPNTPPEPPDSPDAYDPYEPTASPSPAPAASPARPSMTLEAAQKTNMSADEVLDRRPLSPIEKVMALLQSTRDAPPDPPPDAAPEPPAPAPAPAAPPAAAAAPRIVLPEPARAAPPKLFLAKPSPIKSDPIKPMQQATKISRLPLPHVRREPGGESPYSPGSSDFGDLFEPPAPTSKRDSFDALFDKPPRRKRTNALKVPVKLKKKGKTQVDVKLDDDNLKILDELPSSAVEMQVKSKFLKKLNRQERVVEEVKLVLKPHYNKKHVTKEEYKHILRRTVPKICHNKTGEINPTKIQALVEAYVKKFRKKRKLGLV